MQEESLDNKIMELQNHYYHNNQKSRLWGANSQKLDCASLVSHTLNRIELFRQSIYIVSNTNHIFIDYPKFKTYGCPEIYDECICYFLDLIRVCLEHYQTYEIHVNMQSFTPTAAQRYKELIYLFIQKCLVQSSGISQKVSVIYLYQSPKLIDTVLKLFSGLVADDIRQKIVIVESSTRGSYR